MSGSDIFAFLSWSYSVCPAVGLAIVRLSTGVGRRGDGWIVESTGSEVVTMFAGAAGGFGVKSRWFEGTRFGIRSGQSGKWWR